MIYNLPRANNKETWYFNRYVSGTPPIDYSIGFSRSDGKHYSTITLLFINGIFAIQYGDDTTYYQGAWIREIYRTIILNSPATGDLLTWLQANAVKQ